MRSRERERDESACNNQHSLDPVNAIVERERERERETYERGIRERERERIERE